MIEVGSNQMTDCVEHAWPDGIRMWVYPSEPIWIPFEWAGRGRESGFLSVAHFMRDREVHRAMSTMEIHLDEIGVTDATKPLDELGERALRRYTRMFRLIGEFEGDGMPHWSDHRSAPWRCLDDPRHTWQTSPFHRWRVGTRCPRCTKRGATSVQEQALYDTLLRRWPDLISAARLARSDRRQGERREWTVDMLLPVAPPLVIEFDGGYWHRSRVAEDVRKTRDLLSTGHAVIRLREAPLEPLPLEAPALLQIALPLLNRGDLDAWVEHAAAELLAAVDRVPRLSRLSVLSGGPAMTGVAEPSR